MPRNATQTCAGSKLIKPVVVPEKYSGKGRHLNDMTATEYNLSVKEREQALGTKIHQVDHIKQNISLAPNIN